MDETLSTESQRYTTLDMEQRVLEVARWFIARTGCQYGTQVITGAAYTLFYDLDCPVIQVERVTWASDDAGPTSLDATLARELDATQPWWQRQTDTRSRAYFLLGLDRIALWPEPTTAGEDYTVHYQQDVPDDVSAVPVEYHEALVYGATGISLLIDQKVDEGMEDYGLFRDAVKKYSLARSSVDRTVSMGAAW